MNQETILPLRLLLQIVGAIGLCVLRMVSAVLVAMADVAGILERDVLRPTVTGIERVASQLAPQTAVHRHSPGGGGLTILPVQNDTDSEIGSMREAARAAARC
jgi:hypothetical protein